MIKEDNTLESLLELDSIKFIVDEQLGLWVKFEAKKIKKTKERPFGIKYSLSLHNRFNDIKPYYYENAAKLLEDFWREVDKIVQILKEEIYAEA